MSTLTKKEAWKEKQYYAGGIRCEAMVSNTLDEVYEFPFHLLGKTIENYINVVGDNSGLNKSAIANSMIATCAGAIGNTKRLKIEENYFESSIFWFCTVMQSGMAKSPIMNMAIAPLEKRDEVENERFLNEKQLYESNQIETKPMPARRLIAKNFTLEGLVKQLNNNEHGVLLVADEMSSLLASFGAYKASGQGDESEMMTFWNGSNYSKTRANNDNDLFVKNPCVNIVANTPNQFISSLFDGNRENSGFFARWLFVTPRNVKAPRAMNRKPIDNKVLEAYTLLIQKLSDSNESTISLSNEAKSLYYEYDNELANRIDNEGLENDLKASTISKMKTYFLRFALLISQIRFAETETYFDVIKEDMQNAIELSNWFLKIKLELIESLHLVKEEISPTWNNAQKKEYVIKLKEAGQINNQTLLAKKLQVTRKTVGGWIKDWVKDQKELDAEKKKVANELAKFSKSDTTMGNYPLDYPESTHTSTATKHTPDLRNIINSTE